VFDEIANIIYKETKAGTKPGSTIDLFKLATFCDPIEGPMTVLKEIPERLFNIVVDVLSKVGGTVRFS
jgi:hypothetical protein